MGKAFTTELRDYFTDIILKVIYLDEIYNKVYDREQSDPSDNDEQSESLWSSIRIAVAPSNEG
jgi:hypothetical protein